MRICQSCGRENPDDRDFCECGEYLRWDPTGFVQAVTPEMAQKAMDEAAPKEESAPPASDTEAKQPAVPPPAPQPRVEQAAPPPPPDANGHDRPPAPPPEAPKTAVQNAVPAPPPRAAEPEPAAAGASITLRQPDRDTVHGEQLAVGVEPGQRETVLALARNQSGIVDNYELRIEGLPDDWWSIFPDTVYLVPFGSAGTYEQEVEVHLHPPRTPEAEARMWDLQIVAHSKASNSDAVATPFTLGIQPYVETATKVRPERKKGRRKADFTVDVTNKANAPAVIALEGTDPDGELNFGFDRPPTEIRPGDTVQTTMRVKPPKQIWIGRGSDKRFEVTTHTGEEAAERLAAEPTAAEGGAPPAKRRGRFRIPGMSSPQVFKPQLYEPGVSIGPGGINFRKPQFRGPQVQGPQMGSKDLKLSNLKGRGGAAAAAPVMPLLPSQGVFRQRAWLPWWLIPVLALLIALLLLLYMLLPRNAEVPNLVGSASAFEAEELLTDAELKLAATQKEEVSADAPPGSVIGQTPKAGETVEKDSEVALLIAVGNGTVDVPDIVGKTPPDAEKSLRDKGLTLGAASPQPVDPEGKIESQIPAAGEVVKEGTPVDIFFPEPKAAGEGEGEGEGEGGGGGGGAGGGGGGGGGGGEGGTIVVPAVDGAAADVYARKVADEGLLPELKRAFDGSELGTVFALEPGAGTEVESGSKVRMLVSAGFPELVFDNNKNILRVNGANGERLDPVADGPALEKDPAFSPDGTRVAYTGGGRIFLADLDKPDAPAVGLTPEGDQFADLAWAPTADVNVLAFGRVEDDGDRDLCVGRISGGGMDTGCIDEPKIAIGSAIHWAPNGKSILAGGVETASGKFGVVRWKSKKAFSADAEDWGKGRFVTDTSKPGEGVKEAALSPDGRRLALVSNVGGGPFELVLAKPGDFPMTNAEKTGVRACKVSWRPDSRELAVIQADAGCSESAGSLVRVPAGDPDAQQQLAPNADNPVYQPLSLDSGG